MPRSIHAHFPFARLFLLSLLSILQVAFLTGFSRADDWPHWGGPTHDCVWHETGIVAKFTDKHLTGKKLTRVWSAPLSEGYSGPAVAQGLVYITDRDRSAGTERVFCLDAENGKEIWKHEYPVRYTVSYPAGPRATPVINDGRAYTIGAEGDMFCFEARTGKILWQKNFVNDFKTTLPIWGMASAPLVDGNQLITLVGGPDNALVISFDKTTGQELWRSLTDPQVGYAPPRIFTFGGQTRQLIIWHPDAVTSLDPTNGKTYWSIPYNVKVGLCIPTPQSVGNRLFLTSFYNGPRMLEVADNPPSAKILWRGKSDSETQTDGLHSIMPTPVFTKDAIYGICSYGQLRCLDPNTGKRLWETIQFTGKGRWWNAFLIPNGDRIFLANEQGELIITKLSPQGPEEISRAQLIDPTRPEARRLTIWSHPAFALKSVFARNDKEIIRVNLAE